MVFLVSVVLKIRIGTLSRGPVHNVVKHKFGIKTSRLAYHVQMGQTLTGMPISAKEYLTNALEGDFTIP